MHHSLGPGRVGFCKKKCQNLHVHPRDHGALLLLEAIAFVLTCRHHGKALWQLKITINKATSQLLPPLDTCSRNFT
jgi:hypothetical protein